MPALDPEIRLAALEAVVARLLLAQARQHPDPAGMLDQFAGEMRRHADMQDDSGLDGLALGAALLQLVTLAKERLIAEGGR
ncbi:hypothetical protein [Roseococcus thiosulfatophilus]|uniref:hypothetical protein n=1 Tax=Roseococcus thiosulfatophilus TaxID=35813 RepID=UPI001A8D9D22|nr:hypothetical protein [Roseococcus thiosulfatophilus]